MVGAPSVVQPPDALGAVAAEDSWGAPLPKAEDFQEKVEVEEAPVERTPWSTRLLFALMALFAPALLVGGIILLGVNETRAMCLARGHDSAMTNAKTVDCRDVQQPSEVKASAAPVEADLVFVTCNPSDLDPSLKGGSVGLPLTGDFSSYKYGGTGMSVRVSMFQCVEIEEENPKNPGQPTYRYEKRWVEEPVDSSQFRDKSSPSYIANCANETNPNWHNLPANERKVSPRVKLGAVELEDSLMRKMETTQPVTFDTLPTGWWPCAEDPNQMCSDFSLIGRGVTVGMARRLDDRVTDGWVEVLGGEDGEADYGEARLLDESGDTAWFEVGEDGDG